MMDYLEPPAEDNSVCWVYIFAILGSSLFDYVSATLECPVEASSELSDIAWTYLQLRDSLLERLTAQRPSINSLSYSTTPLDSTLTFEVIWSDTFTRLAAIGAADPLYQWGNRICQEDRARRNVLDRVSNWYIFLLDWAPDATHPLIEPLNLPLKISEKIRRIVQDCHYETLRNRIEIRELEYTPTNERDRFIFKRFRIGVTVAGILNTIVEVTMWRAIYDFLSISELSQLDQWGYKNFTNLGVTEYVSLLEFYGEFLRDF